LEFGSPARRWFAVALMETSDAMIVLGFADGYDDMVDLVRSRIVELDLAQEQYGGYLQKVLCGLKRLGGLSSARS
jgi:hypothetical protein